MSSAGTQNNEIDTFSRRSTRILVRLPWSGRREQLCACPPHVYWIRLGTRDLISLDFLLFLDAQAGTCRRPRRIEEELIRCCCICRTLKMLHRVNDWNLEYVKDICPEGRYPIVDVYYHRNLTFARASKEKLGGCYRGDNLPLVT